MAITSTNLQFETETSAMSPYPRLYAPSDANNIIKDDSGDEPDVEPPMTYLFNDTDPDAPEISATENLNEGDRDPTATTDESARIGPSPSSHLAKPMALQQKFQPRHHLASHHRRLR